MEENDAENADKEDNCATSHLIDGDGGVEEADIHQLEKDEMKKKGNEVKKQTVVPTRSQAAGSQSRRMLSPRSSFWPALDPGVGSASTADSRSATCRFRIWRLASEYTTGRKPGRQSASHTMRITAVRTEHFPNWHMHSRDSKYKCASDRTLFGDRVAPYGTSEASAILAVRTEYDASDSCRHSSRHIAYPVCSTQTRYHNMK